MNGRQRCGCGIVSHESGRTIKKKIAKVAVGNSTARCEGYGRRNLCGSRTVRPSYGAGPRSVTRSGADSVLCCLLRVLDRRRELRHPGCLIVLACLEQGVLDRGREPRG